jgi:hypothetical protein
MTITVDIAWPETIPLPFLDFSGSPRNATISSTIESPRIEQRSRFGTSYGTLSVQWVLTAAELVLFETFYNDTLGNGTSCFSIDLRFPKNSQLTEWMVRFVDTYGVSYTDGVATVESKLDLVRQTTISDAAS